MTIFVFYFFALGLIVGSFLNVCIYRLPLDQSIAWPGSRCTSCGRTLAWYENVPVISWTVLRGRCRTCQTSISWMYPVVELVTGLLYAGLFLVYGLTPLFAVRLIFVSALIVLFAIDAIHQILPNVITLPGIVIGFAVSFLVEPGWTNSLIGLLVGGVFPFLVAEGYFRIRGREGMGMGDFKMLAMVGAFLGFPLVWITIILSCILGIVVGGGALLVSRKGLGTRIPFGTFIAVAALICACWQEPTVRLYEQVVQGYLRWAGLA